MTRTKQFTLATTFLAALLTTCATQSALAQSKGSADESADSAPLKLTGPPWLGVRMSDDPVRGVRIAGVAHRSPAQKAGIKPGDQILRVGSEVVKSSQHLQILVRGRRSGDALPLRLQRAGNEIVVTVKLEEMPLKRDVLARHLVGRVAPNFEIDLVAPDGGKTDLDAFEGKPMVLEFWATWCAPCRVMSKNLTALKKAHGDDLHVVAVSAEPQNIVTDFVRRKGTSYVVAHDSNRSLHDSYFVDTFPTVVLIDSDGKVAAVGLGNDDFPRFKKQVESLLKRESR